MYVSLLRLIFGLIIEIRYGAEISSIKLFDLRAIQLEKSKFMSVFSSSSAKLIIVDKTLLPP